MKRPMKKVFFSLLLLFVTVVFAACSGGSSSKSKTYVKEDPSMNVEMIFTYEGDKVTHQKTINTMPYTSLGVTTKEDAQAILDPIAAEYQGHDGLTEKIDYKEDHLVEVVEIDYSVADVEEIRDIAGMVFEGDVSNGISLKRSEEMLLEQGFTEKK